MSTEKQNQYFNGIKFYKRADNAYWYSCTTVNGKRVYMHRYVWEYYNKKPIPKDYAIHHIDLDRNNNDISNLQYLPKKEHAKLHAELNKQNEMITNMIKNKFTFKQISLAINKPVQEIKKIATSLNLI